MNVVEMLKVRKTVKFSPKLHGSSGPPSFTCLKIDKVKEVLSE